MEPVRDKGYFVWIICLFLGIGILLPFNAIITPVYYWLAIFPDFKFMLWGPLIFNYCNITTMLFSTKFGDKIPTKAAVILFFAIDLIMLAIIPMIRKVKSIITLDTTPEIIITLVCIGFCGVSTAILFSKVMAITARLPPNYTGAVMMGNGVGGILVTIILLASSDFSNKEQTIAQMELKAAIFFGVGAGLVLVCIIFTAILDKLSFYQHHQQDNEEIKPLMNTFEGEVINKINRIKIFKKIWVQGVSVFLVFAVTLSIFPGLSAGILPETGGIFDSNPVPSFLYPTIMSGTFQLFDFIGRSLPGVTTFVPAQFIWIPVFIRFVFIAVFMMLFVPLGNPLIYNDWIALISMALMSLTNGYFGTLPMIYGPSNRKLKDFERPIAGSIMGFCLQLGIITGVHLGLLYSYILTGKI
eukprot:TRINITY_DN120_c0_g1_i1.p1 TRINITY_DN120_c0_g1~~TRINITY_DN120_c0_g1_i1.p1  ORF type:complete len:413 (+),score=49.48 TRINITY_DN120_c0_g1_i1:273-1511(+)